MTDAEKKPCCCAAEPAEKDTAPSCCRHKDRTPEEYRALANRLSRIEGQVRGIRAMLDKDVYCADILVQVAAVNAALNGFSKELLGQHIRTCVADDLKAGETQKLDELLQLLPLRKRMSVQCLQRRKAERADQAAAPAHEMTPFRASYKRERNPQWNNTMSRA